MAIEVEEEKMFKFNGVFWMFNDEYESMYGPFCPDCRVSLLPDDNPFEDEKAFICSNCEKKFKLKKNLVTSRNNAKELLYARFRMGLKVEALDLPVGRVIDTTEDENYWVEARMGQYKGKKTAIIYFGDKSKRGSKVQFFIDLEDEQARFHANDAHPSDIASKVIIEFPKSTETINKK